jgi:hypothetical protein
LLYLKLLDIADKIRAAKEDDEADKDKLYGEYYMGIYDLCSQYETIYDMLENDMTKVKTELLNSFSVN